MFRHESQILETLLISQRYFLLNGGWEVRPSKARGLNFQKWHKNDKVNMRPKTKTRFWGGERNWKEVGISMASAINSLELSWSDFNDENTLFFPVEDYPPFADAEPINWNSLYSSYKLSKKEGVGSLKKEFNFFDNSLLFGSRKDSELTSGLFRKIIGNHNFSSFFTFSPETLPDFLDFPISFRNCGEEYSKSSSNSSIASLSKNNPYVSPFLSTILSTPFNLSRIGEGTFDNGSNSSLSSSSFI